MIDVAPIRKAVEESGVAYTEIARQLGWTTKNPQGHYVVDGYRVKRTLGIVKYYSRGGRKMIYRKRVSDSLAVAILDAINKVPADIGV